MEEAGEAQILTTTGQNESLSRSIFSLIWDHLGAFCLCLLGTAGVSFFFLILVGLSLIVPTAMIVMGWIHLHQCPVEPNVPIYLIVGGVFALLQSIALGYQYQVGDSIFTLLLTLFNTGWFIAGCVWIYRIYEPNYADPTSPDYCRFLLYKFAFWLVNSTFVLLGVVFLIAPYVVGFIYFPKFFEPR